MAELSDTQDAVLVPVTFAILDCSSFVFGSNEVHGRSDKVGDIFLDVSAAANSPLLANNAVLPYEPVIINFDR
jgi:hypothetical protein